jgi:type II secretory pathway component HofQ
VAYQSEDLYTIEVKPVVKTAATALDKKEYKGERLTLNFQDIETRAVLQLLADTSGQNMVISDTAGQCHAAQTPWDQALISLCRPRVWICVRTVTSFDQLAAEIAVVKRLLQPERPDFVALRSEFCR